MDLNWNLLLAFGWFYIAGAMNLHHVYSGPPSHRTLAALLWFIVPIFILSGQFVRADEDEDDDEPQQGA